MLSVWRVFVNCSRIDRGKSVKKKLKGTVAVSEHLPSSAILRNLRKSSEIIGNRWKMAF